MKNILLFFKFTNLLFSSVFRINSIPWKYPFSFKQTVMNFKHQPLLRITQTTTRARQQYTETFKSATLQWAAPVACLDNLLNCGNLSLYCWCIQSRWNVFWHAYLMHFRFGRSYLLDGLSLKYLIFNICIVFMLSTHDRIFRS